MIGFCVLQTLKHTRSEEVTPDNCQVARRFVDCRFLNEVVNNNLARSDFLACYYPVLADLTFGNRLNSQDAGAVLFEGFDHGAGSGSFRYRYIVAQQDHTRLLPDMVFRQQYGMPETQRLTLTNVVNPREPCNGFHQFQLVGLAFRPQKMLEFGGLVEMILDRPLASTGDNQNILQSRSDSFLDHVLNRGLVHDGEHLFRLRFCGGEEPCPETCSRNNSLLNLNRHNSF